MRRAGAIGLAGLALAAAPALAQSRLPLPDLLTVPPLRGTAHPRLDELNTAHPPLWRQDDLREPDLGGPVAPPVPLSSSILGTVRASDAVAKGPVARIRELFPAIRACWQPPDPRERLEATIRVAFHRDGSVLGEPRITYQKAGPDEARARFRRSVVEAVRGCSPLAFRSSFGQAIAGRPVAIRFVDDRTP